MQWRFVEDPWRILPPARGSRSKKRWTIKSGRAKSKLDVIVGRETESSWEVLVFVPSTSSRLESSSSFGFGDVIQLNAFPLQKSTSWLFAEKYFRRLFVFFKLRKTLLETSAFENNIHGGDPPSLIGCLNGLVVIKKVKFQLKVSCPMVLNALFPVVTDRFENRCVSKARSKWHPRSRSWDHSLIERSHF